MRIADSATCSAVTFGFLGSGVAAGLAGVGVGVGLSTGELVIVDCPAAKAAAEATSRLTEKRLPIRDRTCTTCSVSREFGKGGL